MIVVCDIERVPFQVTYVRTGPQAGSVETSPEFYGRRIANRSPIQSSAPDELGQMPSNMDYLSYGDAFSDVSQSGDSNMRTAGTAAGRRNVNALSKY